MAKTPSTVLYWTNNGLSEDEARSKVIADQNNQVLNKRFGNFIAIKLVELGTKTSHHTKWLCRCICGNEEIIRYDCLIYKKRNFSCKNCQLKMKIDSLKKELIGRQFDWLTVIDFIEYNKTSYWKCQCKCGKIIKGSFFRLNSKSLTCCGDRSCVQNRMFERYGFKNNFQRPEIQKKYRESYKRKYGVDNPSYLPTVIEKRREKYRSKNNGKLILEWAKEYNKNISTLGQHIKKYGLEKALKISKKTSGIELAIESLLPSNCSYNRNQKIGNYIPDFIINNNIVIECDGIYWHSDKVLKDKFYHQTKRNFYISQNLYPLFFREDEINNKPLIVQSIIYNKLNISKKYFARNTTIAELDLQTKKNFFNTNHLMGHGKGKSYGLFIGDLLVAAIQVINHKNNIEISRFCNKLYCIVVGGLSKLISYIIKQYKSSIITSFVDLRYGNGKSLEKLGFVLKNCQISFRWTSCQGTFHRMKYPNNSGYIKGLSKIWDCGQAKYILKLKNLS